MLITIGAKITGVSVLIAGIILLPLATALFVVHICVYIRRKPGAMGIQLFYPSNEQIEEESNSNIGLNTNQIFSSANLLSGVYENQFSSIHQLANPANMLQNECKFY